MGGGAAGAPIRRAGGSVAGCKVGADLRTCRRLCDSATDATHLYLAGEVRDSELVRARRDGESQRGDAIRVFLDLNLEDTAEDATANRLGDDHVPAVLDAVESGAELARSDLPRRRAAAQRCDLDRHPGRPPGAGG